MVLYNSLAPAVLHCLLILQTYTVGASTIAARRGINNIQQQNRHLARRDASSTLVTSSVAGENWSGWKGVEKIFSFGDSYTDTGFDPAGAQPNGTYPLGNPFTNSTSPPYHTFASGPNWIQYLTFKYNESQINTYNLAVSGATVNDSALGATTTNDLVNQVTTKFKPNYSDKNTVGWTASNSLFTLFLGVNDVDRSWRQHDLKINDAVFASYTALLETLYTLGARNFLLHTIPPINRGPFVSPADHVPEGNDINDFNYRMQVLYNTFTTNHTADGISVLLFNTNKLFSEVIDNPGIFPQTAGYKNTTGACRAYNDFNLPSMDFWNQTACERLVNEYLWLNGLHPTYPVHEALAAQVAVALT
ncbi:MAG: hypothetical protein Q9222_006340 [Ikaeria aurantiellina]